MDIVITNAYANNLKNIKVRMPIGKITAITGVSGSGKSSLLKNVIASYGYKNFTRIASNTVKSALCSNNSLDVDNIENLPNTILIDVKNSITTPMSTVSTISGLHELLRNIYTEFGGTKCLKCGSQIKKDFSCNIKLSADFIINDLFFKAIEFINENGCIIKTDYFDKNKKTTDIEKKRFFATVQFSLKKLSEKIIKDFNNSFHCRLHAFKTDSDETYDLLREIECPFCNYINPSLTKSRFSFNTKYEDGGGACRTCDGTGIVTEINPQNLIIDKKRGILDGASPLIGKKGIKYTTVTEKFINAIYKTLNLDINSPIDEIPDDKLKIIFFGSEKHITFVDRTGGKKTMQYNGIVNYLMESYRAGKGKKNLHSFCKETTCPDCFGTRLDKNVRAFKLHEKSLNDILQLNLTELNDLCKEIKTEASDKETAYLSKIIKETDFFNFLSCGHLSLNRASNSLSGGELQRVRICALLNSDVNGICYLLDEPSSGLHYSDIEKMAALFNRIKAQGNTVIMVEHNKKMLQYCDYIVDMGPSGGKKGGEIMFSDILKNVYKYDSFTANELSKKTNNAVQNLKRLKHESYLEFKNISFNNLKNISTKFPRNAFTAVCGISGSGKSTFVRRAVYDTIASNPEKYGFEEIEYLAQASIHATNLSTVATILDLSTYIAQIFATESNLPKDFFMLNNSKGKCSCCSGKGYLYSEEGEPIGICELCKGLGFSSEVLSVNINGLNIYDYYNTNIEDLVSYVKNKKLKTFLEAGKFLGIGYLSLSRNSKTLSKGELQRISLMKIIAKNVKNRLIILDEPSNGLHLKDSINLLYALRQVVSNGNTVIAVEHNPEIIRNADYIIEFGGTGTKGGHILFEGEPEFIKDTPTASMLKDSFMQKNLRTSENKSNNIIISGQNEILQYAPYNIYFEQKNVDFILNAAKKSINDFLSVAIPNNIMFSKLDKNIINSNTPVIITIDFLEKIKYSISIADALGITELLKKCAKTDNSNLIDQFIFDSNAKTGKCSLCGGTGKTMSVDENYFILDDNLTAECKKFLRNSTNYLLVAKNLKKTKIDITKSIDKLSSLEHKVLFWGNEKKYSFNDEQNFHWRGIIPNFIDFHKYYSDKSATDIFATRKEITCPYCKGKMLEPEYQNLTCLGLHYFQWMSMTIETILDKVGCKNDYYSTQLYYRLEIAKKLRLEKYHLSDFLINMDCKDSEKVKFASLFLNRIYGIGVLLKNLDVLEKSDVNMINSFVKSMSNVNTIWIA